MKVIFLDVDGVLNHSECQEWENGHWNVIDNKCVGRIKDICRRTGAKIVVSSTWRLSQEGMSTLLQKFGELIIGVTGYLQHSNGKLKEAPRHEEIQEWILRHSTIVPFDFVVIDDDTDAEIKGLDRYIQTGFESGGLTQEKAEKVVKILGEIK